MTGFSTGKLLSVASTIISMISAAIGGVAIIKNNEEMKKEIKSEVKSEIKAELESETKEGSEG